MVNPCVRLHSLDSFFAIMICVILYFLSLRRRLDLVYPLYTLEFFIARKAIHAQV